MPVGVGVDAGDSRYASVVIVQCGMDTQAVFIM